MALLLRILAVLYRGKATRTAPQGIMQNIKLKEIKKDDTVKANKCTVTYRAVTSSR